MHEKVRNEWIQRQVFDLESSAMSDVAWKFKFNTLYGRNVTTEYWYKVGENVNKTYKQVIHVDSLEHMDIKDLAVHCQVYKLNSSIFAGSWYNKALIYIELIPKENLRQEVLKRIELKTLLEA